MTFVYSTSLHFRGEAEAVDLLKQTISEFVGGLLVVEGDRQDRPWLC